MLLGVLWCGSYIKAENYNKFIESKETEYNVTYNKVNNRECIVYPFDGSIVPAKIYAVIPSYRYAEDGSIVPEEDNNENGGTIIPSGICSQDGVTVPMREKGSTITPSDEASQEGILVPCYPSPFEIRSFKKKKEVKQVTEEPVETTIARVGRAVYLINNKMMFPSRPDRESRVYCEVTNLNRELRKLIRLDGKKIIGVDIANSQPLIASILIRNYWLNKKGHLPEDVKQYQSDCEAGIFYENFMKAIKLPNDLRSQFKQDFFKKVFFSKVIEKNNMLKDMFIKKYPGCWEAICDQKGGLYCTEYNEFAKVLQRVEAGIIFDVVNMGLIKKGIKAFNIFDSIYVNNKEDLETAKLLIKEAFSEAGVNPTLKTEYEEHSEENERTTFAMVEKPATIVDVISTPNESEEQLQDDDSWTMDDLNATTDEEIAEIYERLNGPISEQQRAYRISEIRYRMAGMLER